MIIHHDPRDGVALAAFKSERWPASRRNSGRLQIGTPGRLRRNTQCNGFGREQAIAEYIFAALLGRPVPLISGNSLTGFSLLDWLALIVFGFGWLGYEVVVVCTAGRRPTLQ